MKFKIDFSLPKLVRFRVGIQVGTDVGAKLDVRLRLRGRDPLRWKAALGPSRARELPEPEVTLPPGHVLPRA
jgi:hypothetical protein